MRRFLWIPVALLCAILLVCGRQPEQLNLVIIGVDTLRRDHLGCYGYERRTSPNIDHLAQQGVLFEDVVSQAPWTLPSFASIFTSLYPSQHGGGFMVPGAGSFGRRMGSDFPTLAIVLLKHGYSTGAIINAPALAPEFGVDRGFEYYLTTPRWEKRDAEGTTEDALRWIDQHGSEPFFLFVHYFDPHEPYEPPAPYDTLFDPGYQGRIGSSFNRDRYCRLETWLANTEDPEVSAAWNHIRSLYDGEIAFTDKAIADLLDGLEKRGLRDKTLIVFISDHGEEFYDHGGFEHGHTLYEELIKVPLIMSLPGRLPAGKRIKRQVRSIDVLPTVLDIMGIEPPAHHEGVSLVSLITEGKLDVESRGLLPANFAYTEAMLYGSEKKAVVSYPWKLIYDTATKTMKLYRLDHDPGEVRDLTGQETETADLFEEVLFKTMFAMAGVWHVEVGGLGHEFDIELRLPTRPLSGSFREWRFFDGSGRLVKDEVEAVEYRRGDEVALEVKGLKIEGTLEMVVEVMPEQIPCTFDIKIDGRREPGMVYLGAKLEHPDRIPFKHRMRRHAVTRGRPGQRPDEPYVLVWHSGGGYTQGMPARMSEDTRRKLKALGYIQ